MQVITRSSVFAAVFLGMFVASARAEEIITVKVPFPFVVNHRELPAGHYDIRTGDDGPSVIWIEGMNNRSVAVALTTHVNGHDPAGNQPALVFIRDGDQYQLSQVWESSTDGLSLPEKSVASKHERAEVVLTCGPEAGCK